MSNFAEMKKAFYREIVAHGIYAPEQFREAFPLGYEVPRATIERWFTRFRRVDGTFCATPRHVNHFKLGADPEFVFTATNLDGQADRIDAHQLGLKQGPAFGEDNNGRLAEIRPYPSRSALEVCASVLATLRWMAIIKKQTTEFMWQSGAFLFRDGIGGHVHFGRKRPTRSDEVKALDNVMEMLMEMGVYPKSEVVARRAGDARNQRYGQLGDYRMQTHGYEYRTFPSWLDSPSLAFFTLAISKLTVHDPGLVLRIQQVKSARAIEAIVNLLAYYQDLDDDARLAHNMVQRGIPKHVGGDFKERWGVETVKPIPMPHYVPMAIKPDMETIVSLRRHLLTGDALGYVKPKLTWSPAAAPKGYRMVIDATETIQRKGLGECVWDLCTHESMGILFTTQSQSDHQAALVSESLARGRDSMKIFGTNAIRITGDKKNYVMFNSHWLDGGKARLVKKWILNGRLPLWRIGDVTPDSIEKWKASAPVKERMIKNSVVFSHGGALA